METDGLCDAGGQFAAFPDSVRREGGENRYAHSVSGERGADSSAGPGRARVAHCFHITQADCTIRLIELYIDETTYAVAVKETSQNKMWYALPQQDNGKEENRAAVVSLEVLQGGKHYSLNSQDNSVAFGTASYELIDNGLKVSYRIAVDEKTAKKAAGDRSATDIAFDVSVTYTLEDGSFFAQVDCKPLIEQRVRPRC